MNFSKITRISLSCNQYLLDSPRGSGLGRNRRKGIRSPTVRHNIHRETITNAISFSNSVRKKSKRDAFLSRSATYSLG